MSRAFRMGGVLLLAAAWVIAGCGGDGGSEGGSRDAGDSPAAALDKVAPAVTYVTPSNNASQAGTNTRLTVTFSEPMSEPTLAKAIGLIDESSGAAVALQAIAFDRVNQIATVTPQTPLAPERRYRAEVSASATDLAGNALANAYAWRFGTGAGADTTPPTVTSYAPAAGATGVPAGAAIAMSFSEPMDVATVSAAFALTDGAAAAVAGSLAYVGQAAVFSPAAALAPNTRYEARLRRSATDLAGNALAADQVWTFTTGARADTTPPTVLGVSPAPAATMVAHDAALSVRFDEPIFPFVFGTIDGVIVEVAIDFATNTVHLLPTAPLRANAGYNGSVLARDLAGNAMSSPYRWDFVTAP